ncbi:MAG: hypothetical protein ACLP19_18175 [Xanthobacteraceae bacterium]
MSSEKKDSFWVNANSTTTSVSSGVTVSPTPLVKIEVSNITALSDEEFRKLSRESEQANNVFEAAKTGFQEKYSIVWNPTIEFTSEETRDASKKIVELRDTATQLFARLLAVSKK